MAIRTPLLKHQRELVELIQNKTYWAILWECGCAKTLGTLAVIDARKKRFPKYRTLVVLPCTLIENWVDEITTHTDMTYQTLTGTKAQRLIKLDRPADIYIINYEALRIMADNLIYKKFDLIVFDESQALKGYTTQQSKGGQRVAMSCPHRLILTGTPIHNGPLDCFGQFRVLSPDIFGSSYYRFRATYAIMGGFMNRMIVKYINMNRFKEIILKCSSIKTKEEVLDLPPRTYEVIHVELTETQTRMYKELREEFLASNKGEIVTAPVMLTRIMRFSQITAGFYKTVDGKEVSYEKNPKQEWLIEWLKDHGHKTVVFVRFIKELKDLEDALRKCGIKFVSVYGETVERINLVKAFNNEADIQVFIGQIDTAGQGINLQSSAYCVFLSNNYSYGDREQAESRIHRQGQKAKNCTYIDVVARGTIDERVLKILKKKESLAGMLTSDIRSLV